MTVTAHDPTTVRAPLPRHLVTYLVAAAAALALTVSLVLGLADSGSSPAVPDPAGRAVVEELPSRFGEGRFGSADAMERDALGDQARRYGSADAAEHHDR